MTTLRAVVIVVVILATVSACVIAISIQFQPRSKPMARAGGDLASQVPAGGEVAVRHPVKDQGRVPQ